MFEMTVLLWANMRFRPHGFATHGASRPSGRNDGGRFRANVACLLARDPAREGGIAFVISVDVVSDDDEAIFVFVIPELHPANAKLLSCLAVELVQIRTRWQDRSNVRQALQHLLQREAQRMNLLLFHPDRIRLCVDDRQQPESPLARLPNRFYLNAIRVEISNHVLASTC